MTASRILIIDDDPAQHMILQTQLEEAGYEVLHAHNGIAALKLMDRTLPDMILLDINMPGISGFDTLKAIRGRETTQDTPVLFLTSMRDKPNRIQGLELGADDYLVKPVDGDELLARIRAILRRLSRSSRTQVAEASQMTGDLGDLSLSDLLQSMEIGLKTARIALPEMDAEIFVKDGKLVAIRQGDRAGDDALVRILLLERGAFTVWFGELPAKITETPRPVTSALMTTAAAVDDIRDKLARMKVTDVSVKVIDTTGGFQALAPYLNQPPILFLQLVVNLPGKLEQNLILLARAAREGRLSKA